MEKVPPFIQTIPWWEETPATGSVNAAGRAKAAATTNRLGKFDSQQMALGRTKAGRSPPR
jgi:hypothetical protein